MLDGFYVLLAENPTWRVSWAELIGDIGVNNTILYVMLKFPEF